MGMLNGSPLVGRRAFVLRFSLLALLVSPALGTTLDPEDYIRKRGYEERSVGDDGKTAIFRSTEHVGFLPAGVARLAALERDIALLPKHPQVAALCEMTRAGVKAALLERKGLTYNVTVLGYGYSGSTIACHFRYTADDLVSSQVMFMKRASDGLYTVFVTD